MFYAVELPWGFPRPKSLVYDAEKKTWFYRGPILPPELRPFQSLEFSRERWHEDEKNGLVSPITPGEVKFTPKAHQLEAAKKIAGAYNDGWSGFLLADKTGLGKTLSALTGLALMAKMAGKDKGKKATVLIVCPKSVIPVWRQTLRNYRMAHPLLRPLIINYHQLQKLLSAPPEARVNPKKSRKSRQIARTGKPLMKFDYIVFDESHYLKNYPSSNMSLIASRIAELDTSYRRGSSPFVIFSTATPGSTPLNFAVMSGFMSKLINPRISKRVGPKDWGNFLMDEGFSVTKGKTYSWAVIPWFGKDSKDPKERARYEKSAKEAKLKQRKDTQRIGRALVGKSSPFIMRSPKDIAGWPEQQIIAMPIELTPKQKQFYNEAWSIFRNWLNLTPARKDPKGQLVQTLRYRQKTSLLRLDYLVEAIADWVEEDKQVFVSLEFLETVGKLREALEKKKIVVAELSGRIPGLDKEAERIRFQKGFASVVISTSVEGISFHSNEILPDGSKATSNERITILADIRQNPLNSLQALGRAHRDGQNSIAYVPYIEDSVDKRVVESFVNKVINQDIMMGKDAVEAEELEKIFRTAAAKTTPPTKLS